MAHKKGANLGGIRSIKDIKDRCRIDPETGCWLWGLSMYQGAPRVHFVLKGKKHTLRGRRAVKMLQTREPVATKMICFGKEGCPNECLNPAHIIVGTGEEAGAALGRSGRLKNIPSKVAASFNASAKLRKLTDEQVQIIREGNESAKELAARFGVHPGHIHNIRRRVFWRKGAANSSVFNWRPAA